ncbi:MAG: rod shape-determining protein RodA [Bacteroidota bacterium]|nr:rod shape-determining protein RodA [Bacteroidota bacterium]MDP4231779.1 rod shape-determining protein RodA [Bacteroidota bacterium]MDP4243514.1 rod shape-determining protein RodA [Bacteroidota bacterium]MDP4287116.1 rod shape-determining protein RodA [Bacteroidota bacterium]
MPADRKQIEFPEMLERKNFDITTFFSVLLLVTAGFLAIYSATYAANMNNRFGSQLLFAAGGIGGMIVMAMLPVRWFQAVAYPLYGISLALLVFVAFKGKLVYGHRSWIAIGGFQFQPSEIAKLATIFTIGAFLNKGRDLSNVKNLLTVCGLVILPVALILKEPDPGTAVIFAGLLVVILLWSGIDLFLLAAVVIPALVAVLSLFGQTPTVIAVLAGGLVLFFVFRRNLVLTVLAFGIVIAIAFSTNFIYEHLHQYQRNRVQVLLDPELDPLGAGYNVIQTRMAIGSGGLTGKGYLRGTQTQLRYVPKQWTDFIISVPAEEFGFVGAVVILLLYLFVIFRGVAIASSVRSIFSSVVAIGIAGIWFLHVTVNIGMALGLMPVIGIPLPFMSYGGSALLTNLLMAGILMNLYRNRKVLF